MTVAPKSGGGGNAYYADGFEQRNFQFQVGQVRVLFHLAIVVRMDILCYLVRHRTEVTAGGPFIPLTWLID